MKKKKLKLTKLDLESMQRYNANQKRIGEPILNADEYLRYIYGKVKIPKKKVTKYRGIDLPNWCNDWRSVPSCSSDGFSEGMTKDDSWKKEISKNYTVAVAYNKGGYQVLLDSEIKTAGRKV